jgi:hypothetical protein
MASVAGSPVVAVPASAGVSYLGVLAIEVLPEGMGGARE